MAAPAPYSPIPTVEPRATPPDDYNRNRATPESFGAYQAQGRRELAAGEQQGARALETVSNEAFSVNKFYGQISADNASNDFQDFATKLLHGDPNKTNADGTPDTGYLGMKGRAALDARPGVMDQIDGRLKDIRSGLKSPEQQLQFDNFSRRYRALVADKIGSHADSQVAAWGTSTNKAAADLAVQHIAINASSETEFLHGQEDLRKAFVQNSHLQGGGPEQFADAVSKADQLAIKTRINAIGAKDPAGAYQMIESSRTALGADYEPLLQQYKARKEMQVGLARGAAAQAGAPMPYQIRDAIYKQESGNRFNIRTSVDNAHGIAQITPGTFNRFAQSGERLDNPDDNYRVGSRIIDYYYQKYNGDPARVAVAYFSGDGNVAPAGSPTPWIRDAKDGNGKSVSSYVGDILGRIGRAEPAGKHDAYQRVKDDPDMNFAERNHAFAFINQQEAGLQSERATVSHLIQDDTASILTTGQPSYGLSLDRVRAVLGPEAADQFAVNRGIAQNYYDRTKDWANLSDAEIYDRVKLLEPDPGQPGFAYAQKLQQHAAEAADDLLKKRYDDPAGSVENMPDVRAAKAANDSAAVVKARLLAQTKLGIPEGAQSPIPDDEAKRYAALLRPVSKGQADVENQDQVINSVVKEVNQKYGQYAQPAMARVLYHVTMKQDAADAMSAAMQRYSKQEIPPLVTPDEARKVQIERDADTAARIAGVQVEPNLVTGDVDISTKTPVQTNAVKPILEGTEKPRQKPFWQAVDLLRSDPVKLMPAFVKRFGEVSVPSDLRQYVVTQPPQGQK
jgi:hypothetical protein